MTEQSTHADKLIESMLSIAKAVTDDYRAKGIPVRENYESFVRLTTMEFVSSIQEGIARMLADDLATKRHKKWERFGILIPQTTRERVLAPVLAELRADCFESFMSAKTKGQRRWVSIRFNALAVLAAFDCLRVLVIRRLIGELFSITDRFTGT